MSEKSPCQLILALDLPSREEALSMLDRLEGAVDYVKIGLQLFTAYGPDFVREVADREYKVFLDLKLHDIPNTVAKAIRGIAALPVELLTLHASGGREMLEWAAAAQRESAPQLRLLAVTVLTSMDAAQLKALNVSVSTEAQVMALAQSAMDCHVHGLVCSSLELAPLRVRFGSDPLIVTPGIRPKGSDRDEQKRIMTPTAAARAGSNFVVVGRPILRAKDPAAIAQSVKKELEASHVSQ